MMAAPDPHAMPTGARPPSRQVRWLWIATAVAGVALAVVTFTAPRGLFSGDEGIKLVQHAERAFDPGGRNYPFSAPFVIENGGRHYGIYPITFVAPSAIGWAALASGGCTCCRSRAGSGSCISP